MALLAGCRRPELPEEIGEAEIIEEVRASFFTDQDAAGRPYVIDNVSVEITGAGQPYELSSNIDVDEVICFQVEATAHAAAAGDQPEAGPFVGRASGAVSHNSAEGRSFWTISQYSVEEEWTRAGCRGEFVSTLGEFVDPE
jgi:hypothetical protein